MNFDEMKAAVRRGAERELNLRMTRGSECQIAGPFMDVRVEGKYLGWCSITQSDELQKIYDSTPSLIRKGPEVDLVPDLEKISSSLGITLKRFRQMEAETLVSGKASRPEELQMIRNQLEVLHAQVLNAEELAKGQRT